MKSNFRTLLVMCVLMIIGLSLAPLIDVANEPKAEQGKTLQIRFGWEGASAKVIEQNATSKIEGMMMAVEGVEEVSSVSYFGSGEVTVKLKKEADVSAVKFEIASLIKNVYPKLPDKVTYPVLSGGEVVRHGITDNSVKRILEYRINAEGSDEQIKEWLIQQIKPLIERVDGVHDVEITGGTGRYIEIVFDPSKAIAAGITMSDIENAVRSYMGREGFVSDVIAKEHSGNKVRLSLYLATTHYNGRLDDIPVKRVRNTVVYLNNLATLEYKDRLPDSYYRVNGLNTIYMNINADADANMIMTARRVMDLIGKQSEEKMHFTLSRNLAEEQMKDLRELAWQSALSFIILIVFVWLTMRNWKYLIIITSTLLADILLAIIAYWLFDIRMHPYSIAGVTVSLGLIIDASIVMTDHYSYYHNRRIFFPVLAALLTTVGALVVIFFLPDDIKHDLRDFTWVIIINLTVALVVAYAFVPAMTDTLHYNSRNTSGVHRKRLCLLWNKWYTKYLNSLSGHKRISVAFGLVTVAALLYFSIYLFTNTAEGSMRKEDKEYILHIRAQMPLGGNAAGLNEKIMILERFISQYGKEIKRFETNIGSWGAIVNVEFTDSAKQTGFPYSFEQKVIGKIVTIGGADWSTYGISDRGFSNSLNLQYRAFNIEISGYDYDQLYRYAEDIMDTLTTNSRIVDAVIEIPDYEDQPDEFYLRYDKEAMALHSIDISKVYATLQGILSQQEAGSFNDGKKQTDVVVKSGQRDKFDLWNLQNSYIKVDTADIKISDFANIARREAKNCIPKHNQEYVLRVAFNVLGSYSYTDKLMKRLRENISDRLPVGFKCNSPSFADWYTEASQQYWLIGIVILIIYMICAILFESFTIPFVIIINIPVSLAGAFLTFHFTGVQFGSGGLASIVLLCGVAVNSAIYIIAHLRENCGNYNHPTIRAYLKAYNHKIILVFLTTLTTMAGLLPFLLNSENNHFWFAFAVGSLGGLAASVFSLVFVMPMFICYRR